MNLLQKSDNLPKQYVTNLMKKNNLEGYSAKKAISRNINYKRLAYISVFVILVSGIFLSAFTNNLPNLIVSANKGLENSQSVLGASTFEVSPLILKPKKSVVSSFSVGDTRTLALQKFLEQKKSPMAPYASVFVETADKVKMDYRLMASVAGIESGFGRITTLRKDGTNGDSFNGWGYNKGYKGDINRFQEWNSWADSIKEVTEKVQKGYGPDVKPETMQYMYCQSCRKEGTKWQDAVKGYMDDIARIEKSLK
jgi:hypothetical protein